MTGRPSTTLRARPTPWTMIAGVGVLAVLALIMLVILLTRGTGDGTAIGTATPTPTPTLTPTASPSATASASPAASATPTQDEGPIAALEPLSVVEVVVDGVTLREEPTTSGERIGTLAGGSQNIVIEGPVDADGYSWYQLAAIGLPPASGCVTPLPTDPLECPVWFGWAAGGDPTAGEPWLATTDVDCPDPDTQTRGYMALPQRLPLACYGSDEIAFTAWFPRSSGDGGEQECEPDPAIAWLYCDPIGNDVLPDQGETAAFVSLFVDPDSGVSLPDPDQWLRITGAYDHPDAGACADANADVGLYNNDDLAVLECRVRFSVSSVEVTSAP